METLRRPRRRLSVLILEPEEPQGGSLKDMLEQSRRFDAEAVLVHDENKAYRLASLGDFDCLLVDRGMGRLVVLSIVDALDAAGVSTPVILSYDGHIDDAREICAYRAGTLGCFPKTHLPGPLMDSLFSTLLRSAQIRDTEIEAERRQNAHLRMVLKQAEDGVKALSGEIGDLRGSGNGHSAIADALAQRIATLEATLAVGLGQEQGNVRRWDMVFLIEKALDRLQAFANEASVTLAFARPARPLMVACAPQKTIRALQAAVQAAIMRSKPRGEVEIFLAHEAGDLVVQVVDEGHFEPVIASMAAWEQDAGQPAEDPMLEQMRLAHRAITDLGGNMDVETGRHVGTVTFLAMPLSHF